MKQEDYHLCCPHCNKIIVLRMTIPQARMQVGTTDDIKYEKNKLIEYVMITEKIE